MSVIISSNINKRIMNRKQHLSVTYRKIFKYKPEAYIAQYANEDVSLGAWFIGLEVEHIDERNMCCGTPPDCEWKKQSGNVCIALFDWSCSGICKSVDKIKFVHNKCSEGYGAVWTSTY